MNSNRAPISIRDAAIAYLGAWLVGNLAAGAVLSASGKDSVANAGPGWLVGISVAQWLPFLVALWVLGRHDPHGAPDWYAFAGPLVALVIVLIARAVWASGIRHYRSTGS